MLEYFTPQALAVLFQVVLIDVALAGDNAVVVGMAAAGLPAKQRAKAIAIGMAGAAVLLIIFAIMATQLLQIIGLLFVGGLLLLWVCWKMWRELRESKEEHAAIEHLMHKDTDKDGKIGAVTKHKTMRQAASQIILADLSMSLDNVLAVGAAAREHPFVLIFGLSLSIFLMGVAATFIAKILQKYRWIAYVGLAIILYVALGMVYRGAHDLLPIAQQIASIASVNG
jgi:YjbE family integral membrane protein